MYPMVHPEAPSGQIGDLLRFVYAQVRGAMMGSESAGTPRQSRARRSVASF